jgi:hypothetical protein
MTDSNRRWLAPGSWDLVIPDAGDSGVAMPWSGAAFVAPAPITQIVFIDGSVPNAQELAQGVQPGVVAVVLNPDQDGVQQIADWLTTHHVRGAGAIDIVAHGADGEVRLGNALLSSATMASYQAQLAQIGGALRPGGDIQLYGCDVAQDATGDAFLQQLSQATGGANIATASHLVGGAAGGGSWNLNVDVGTIDASNPFTAAAINNFTNELSLTQDQLFFTVGGAGAGNPADSSNRVQQISVNGINAASNAIDLADGSSDANTILVPNGIAIDAPLQQFFIANSNSSGNAHNYYELFRGSTNPTAPNQALTKIYSAPHTNTTTTNTNGVILGVALDQPNGEIYFVQNTYDFNYGTYITNQTGIFKISVTNTNAVSQVVTLGGTSTAHDLAVDTKDNLVLFTAADFSSGTLTGVELDAANLSTGSIHQVATIAGANVHAGGVAVNTSSHTAYFTVLNGGTAQYNDIFSIGFNGSGIAVGSLHTLYSGAKADVPEDLAIDPADGVFFTGGANAGIFAGSLTNTSTATLTQVFSISQANGAVSPQNLFLDSTPTITVGGSVTYAQGGAAVPLDSGLTLSDQDGNNLLSGTVVIGGFLTGDMLTATTGSTNISSSFSNGTLTLTGTGSTGGDTLANFQSVLDSVKYSTTNTNPTQNGTVDTRTISWTVNDGVVTSSTPTTTLDIHAAFISASGTATFTGGGSPVVLDGSLTVGDSVGSNFNSATIIISSGFVTGDTLNFSIQNGITQTSFNNGTLILGGSATFAHYKTALQSITYSFSGSNLGNGSRSISWAVGDGTVISPTGTSTLEIVHAAPTITAGNSVTFNGGGSPVFLDSGLVITDPDSTSLTSATIVVGGSTVAGDTLTVGNLDGLSNGGFSNGTLVLSGTAAIANYETALQSIEYSFNPGTADPTGGGSHTSRAITWEVNDGVSSSAVANTTLDVVHTAPTIQTSGTVTYPENGSPIPLDNSITITAPDSSGNLTKASIVVGNFLSSDSLTVASNPGSLTVSSFTNGTLTLTGTSTVNNYLTALESVKFSNSGDPTSNNTDTSRTISWTINDGVSSSSASNSFVQTLCFCAGTHIATPIGETPVERLIIGDLVLTVDGRALPIRWIGTGEATLTPGERNEWTPVIVRAGALADGVPRRDLRVTKGHSLCLDGMLIPAESLINHRTILWDVEASSVTVYHVELETHEVLWAEGAPAESYRDDGNRVYFLNANPRWDAQPPLELYAPIVFNGPLVEQVWRRLLARAALPAVDLTGEPDLHLSIDGERLDAASVRDSVYRFELPDLGSQLCLASRSGIPSEQGIICDHRRLGVAITHIVLRQAGMMLEISAASPLLAQGFHGYEEARGFRWTDGSGVLPPRALAAFGNGPLTIEIHVGCVGHYTSEETKLSLAA